MANSVCVSIDGNGYVFTTSAQPNTSGCSYILTDSQNQIMEMHPFYLSMEEGAQISAAIVAVWAIGFSVRAIVRVIFNR